MEAYSSAMVARRGRTPRLPAGAQRRKIEWHLGTRGADRAPTVLDIGCGWGGMLRAAVASRAPDAPPAVGRCRPDAQRRARPGSRASSDPRCRLTARRDPRREAGPIIQPAEPHGAIISRSAPSSTSPSPKTDSATKNRYLPPFLHAGCRDMRAAPDGALHDLAGRSPGGDPDDKVPSGPLVRKTSSPNRVAAPAGDLSPRPNNLFEVERIPATTRQRPMAEPARYGLRHPQGKNVAEAIAMVGKEQVRRYEALPEVLGVGASFSTPACTCRRFRLKPAPRSRHDHPRRLREQGISAAQLSAEAADSALQVPVVAGLPRGLEQAKHAINPVQGA